MKISLNEAEKMVANIRENGCCGPFAQALLLVHSELDKLRQACIAFQSEWDGKERRKEN